MKKIRGINFGPAWCASGARGFFGEAYWFHRFVPGLDWSGTTFVAKTTTLAARKGNMPLKLDWTPRDRLPRCVQVNFAEACVLNAVGLSGPGAEKLLDTGRWQKRLAPFFVSFMAVANGSGISARIKRSKEAERFVRLLRPRLRDFRCGQVGLQVNLSCPNAGHDPSDLVDESVAFLNLFGDLHLPIPIVAKVNLLFPVEEVRQLPCDGIVISNSIPWGELPDRIDWRRLFGSDASPLADLGGGGLSGAPLLPLVAKWVRNLRNTGYTGHINSGGGIMRPSDVNLLHEAGADSVSMGTIAMLRGWRLRKTIARAEVLFG